MYWQEKITIGNLVVPRIMAAPLDGITDSPTRRLIREFSPDVLLYGEMRHVACVTNEKTGIALRYHDAEHPLAFQFSANSTQFIAQACEKVINAGFAMINLNIGCPARNVVNSGSGSALMAKPDTLKEIITEFMRVINGRVPFTVKMRAGFKEKNAVEIAKLCEGLGVEMLIVHPRTAPQEFIGLPDVPLVAAVKQNVKIPVIFSGNVNSFDRAQKMYDQTGIDGVMIGRALWGCPWKIREIEDAALGKKFTVTTLESIHHAITHCAWTQEFYGGPRGFHVFKKQLPIYLKQLPNAGALRKRLLVIPTYAELQQELAALYQELLTTGTSPCLQNVTV